MAERIGRGIIDWNKDKILGWSGHGFCPEVVSAMSLGLDLGHRFPAIDIVMFGTNEYQLFLRSNGSKKEPNYGWPPSSKNSF